jgi:UDP-N-acetylmuramoyl-L-alanyl-D-glutamate--2,6-diaminopimelate ligase
MVLQTLKRLIPNNGPIRLAWHKSKALAAAVRYGFPAKQLTIIGVTGTDGKTTTTGMIAHILHENGIKVGALSTAFFRINNNVEWNATQKTSPSPFIIQKFLRDLVDAGCTHAVLEYSSHGLVQGRMNYTYPSIAGITNMSAEHLDYHGTMAEYVRAKGLLFEMLKEHGTKVENHDDISFEYLRNIRVDADAVVYSPSSQLEKITATPASASAELTLDGQKYPLLLNIPGTFNLHNALCAICCVTSPACGINNQQAIEALSSFTGIPGRMERIDAGQDFHVFIDFTVTPQSYEATLSTLKKALPSGKRLLVLTGSCGDRMKEKRPIVGKIVSSYADVMVVANEDPYTEDPEKIIDEVWAGVDQSTTEAHRIFDRQKAIEFLIGKAESGDIVILCGKGSDTTMWVKDGQIPWNEREIARDIIKRRLSR